MGWIEEKVEKRLEGIGAAVALEAQKTRVEMSAAFAQTQRGLVIQGARPRPVVRNAINNNGGGRVVGWSLQATGGPVRVLLHDSTDASGDVVAVIDLVDQENQTQWLGPGGISFVDALYVECTGAGTLVGSTYLGAVD